MTERDRMCEGDAGRRRRTAGEMATRLSLSIAARCGSVEERVCGLAPATPPQPSLAPPTHPHPALCISSMDLGDGRAQLGTRPPNSFGRGEGKEGAWRMPSRPAGPWGGGGGDGGRTPPCALSLHPIRRALRHRASALRRLAGEQAGFPPPQRARARLPGKPHPSCGNACRCSLPCARGHAPDRLAARCPRGRTLPDHPSTR